ncbi:MAG: hypothetical protein ACM3QS_04795 [Bacteroidota bacterium]
MRRVGWASLLALLLGLGAGLAYAWVLAPARYANAAPDTLRADFKDQFRTLIAASYSATHNLERARARLALLGDADPVEALTGQAQRMLASGESFQVVQQVAGLASDLQSNEVSAAPTATTPVTLTARPSQAPPSSRVAPTRTPVAAATTEAATEPTATEAATAVFDTPTPRPTMTLTPTARAPFQLASQEQVCNPNLTEGLMQVSALDNRRHQVAGVEIDISWPGGEEAFFTGLKPEIGNGYADYLMQAGVIYSVRAGRSGETVPNLTAPSCTTSSGQTYLGGLKLVFQQP